MHALYTGGGTVRLYVKSKIKVPQPPHFRLPRRHEGGPASPLVSFGCVILDRGL
jgi:hypothetical protein